jgi:N12 class adenine-specific DNA methylase
MPRIAGLPNSDSFRAFDMYLKIRYIQQSPHTRGVVFATGTPISNTLAEMYTVLRYLAPPLLESTGTRHFDAWQPASPNPSPPWSSRPMAAATAGIPASPASSICRNC